MNSIFTKFGKKKTITAIVIVVVIIIVIIIAVAKKNGNQYQFVSVTQGSITQVVSVTGNTTPVQDLDLSFPTGGTIAAVYKNAGDNVNAGDSLVSLDTRTLQAQLAQAQAAVAGAQATLQQLQAGPTAQNVQVSQTALATAQQTLANTYSSVDNTLMSAFAKSSDAIENQIISLYNNPDSANPQLSFSVNDSQVANNASAERLKVGEEMITWQKELSQITPSTPTSTLTQALNDSTNYLNDVSGLLNIDATAIVDANGLSSSLGTTYKNDLTNAITEVDTASTGVSTVIQNIASEEAAIAQAQAQLNLTLAGSTPGAIAAQQAQVQQDQANAQSIQVQIAQGTLNSPINGVVTVQNAKVGQIAPAGQTITSIISGNNFEVDAEVPETDIGQVAVGNTVDMNFDAFPGENFTGKVFYIDPAQTIVGGVVDYQIKVSFDTPDPRIKSGLTANLNINTKTDANTLILPQYAIIQNASGSYVDILQNGAETQVPITLGIRDQNGNVEVLSGVTNGEQVINIGLKSQ